MKPAGKTVGAIAAASLLVPGIALAASAADTPAEPQWVTVEPGAVVSEQAAAAHDRVSVPNVQGRFGYTQAHVTATSDIHNAFTGAAAALCEGSGELTVRNASDWRINVSGEVANPYAASLGELAEDGSEQTVILGCSCAGNPADGRASINAEVTGVPLATIVERAQPATTVNAVTLVSEDGYELTLPLDYVLGRDAVVACSVNGEALEATMGGTNQLWMGSTAAKYFTRNIVEVVLTSEKVAPAAPTAKNANLPNISVLSAG